MTSSAASRPRYASLDVLRGLAILGTLGTNIWIFTNPEGLVGYLSASTVASTPRVWAAVEAVLQQLTQGKFLGLLTLMFGIGLEIQRRSAQRAGRPWPGRYPVRAGLLFLDGVLHYLLVVEFDVLMGYAVTGLVVAYLLATSERAQRRWMVVAVVFHLTLLTLTTVALALYAPPSTTGRLDPNPYADGSWLDLIRFRVENAGLFRLEPVFITGLSVAMFLLGARLVRNGVLDHRGHRLRVRLLQLGAVALLADLAVGLFGGPAGIVLARYGTAPLVALGLLALVAELMGRGPEALQQQRAVRTRWLANVGRMALSCYVLQNVVASALCYGWGLGLAARLPGALYVPATVGLYLVTASVVVVSANLWLRRFSRGPVELAWTACSDAIVRRLPQPALTSTSGDLSTRHQDQPVSRG